MRHQLTRDRLLVWTAALALAAGLGLGAQQPITAGVPSGAIWAFDRTTATGCPVGWTEFTNARGVYVVGLVSGGTLNTLVGTRLTDQENRPAGSHTHTITDPGHSHGGVPAFVTLSNMAVNADFAINDNLGNSTDVATTGVTVNAAGSVAGTNGPYLQLLMCQKS